MTPEKKRFWILRLSLIGISLVSLVVGLALAGDPISGGPGSHL